VSRPVWIVTEIGSRGDPSTLRFSVP